MEFKPLYDKILVSVIEEVQKTKSGIMIPDNAKEKPSRGKVLEVGEGIRQEDGSIIPLSIKKDDIVLFGKYSGTEVKLNDKEYLIIKESDIFGIIKN